MTDPFQVVPGKKVINSPFAQVDDNSTWASWGQEDNIVDIDLTKNTNQQDKFVNPNSNKQAPPPPPVNNNPIFQVPPKQQQQQQQHQQNPNFVQPPAPFNNFNQNPNNNSLGGLNISLDNNNNAQPSTGLFGGIKLNTIFSLFSGSNNNNNLSNVYQNFYNPQQQQGFSGNNEIDIDNEPPLLEDLGIDVNLIQMRTLGILTLKQIDQKFVLEPDLCGPILLGLTLGFLLMLSGKLHFGYIYGFGFSGCIILYMILNLMSQHKSIPLYNVLSILGYCLLPLVFLAFINVIFNLKNFYGTVFSLIAILWATYTASNFFEEVLELAHKKPLAAYPTFLFYFTFVLITIF